MAREQIPMAAVVQIVLMGDIPDVIGSLGMMVLLVAGVWSVVSFNLMSL